MIYLALLLTTSYKAFFDVSQSSQLANIGAS